MEKEVSVTYFNLLRLFIMPTSQDTPHWEGTFQEKSWLTKSTVFLKRWGFCKRDSLGTVHFITLKHSAFYQVTFWRVCRSLGINEETWFAFVTIKKKSIHSCKPKSWGHPFPRPPLPQACSTACWQVTVYSVRNAFVLHLLSPSQSHGSLSQARRKLQDHLPSESHKCPSLSPASV